MSGQLTFPGRGPFGPETTRKEVPCGLSQGLDVRVSVGDRTVSPRPPAVASVWQTQAGSPAAPPAFWHTCPALGPGVFICEMGVALFLAPSAPLAPGQQWVGGGARPCCPCADRGSTAFGAWLRATPGQDPGAFPLFPQHRLMV